MEKGLTGDSGDGVCDFFTAPGGILKELIYVVRNKQVMIDSDLAMLYQVETKALNRAVKRNVKRNSQ